MKKLLVTFALLVFTATAHTQPSESVLSAWLSAFNSGELAAIEAFHQQYGRGDPRDAQRDFDMRQRTGGFDLQSIEQSTPTIISALLRERGSDRFGRIQIDLAPGAPPKILGMRLQPAVAPPAGGTNGPVIRSETAARQQLQSYLEAETAADRFAGAVLVAKDGDVLFERAYGLANRAHRLANTTATRFRIGSMNKIFTAVAILQLVEAGKVELDDTLATFLPGYPNQDLARRVTIDQLLNHRGGTGDFFGPEYFAHKDEIRSLDDYIARFGARPAVFPPGERFEYSNFGYILLGAVIERVTGRSYYEYVQREIYDRAGMKRTGSEPEGQGVEALSVGYTRQNGAGAWQPNTPGLPFRGTSAGGGYSTLRDLFAFSQALQAGKLLGPDSTARLLGGYALRNRLADGAGYIGHNGGAPGMNGDLRIYPRSGYVTIALANVDPPAADAVTELLDGVLPIVGPGAAAKN